MPQTEVVPELRDQLREYLREQGYKITEDAKLVGKSGIKHSFDMLAEKDDGFSSHTVAICIAAGGNREQEASTIFSFANKAFDTGLNNRLLIAVPEFTDKSKQLATKQRIKVLDGKQLGSLLAAKPKRPASPEEPFKFETRAQLIESLASRGYRVEEKGKVKGRSGVEYAFDVLAYTDGEQVSHRLAIDFLNSDKEVGLEQVALFDTKAYDAGIDDKFIVVSPGLSPEAKQFAQHQRIRILEPGHKPPAAAKPTPTVEKPETPATKAQPKLLRQMPQPEALQLVPEVMARRYSAIPLSISGNTLQVAMADSTDIFALEAFAAQSRMRIEPIAATAREVREAIDFNYKAYGEIEKQISRIDIPDEITDEGLAISATLDTPLTQALSLIVEEAVKARASDIHIEPEEDRLRIRYRIDGILQDMMSLPLNVRRSLISRIKILADLNIADHQRPQDGQFTTVAKGREIDVRVAMAPSVWGEMSVLRLLDKSMAVLELSELGLLDDGLARYQDLLKVPYGMILISGPTGAGKTTTLYASVNSLDKLGRNIVTIEDPAEYRFKDINQIQVNTQAGITFASGLRSILRLDPDVILVGEIRDGETANIAVQAALTGHLVLSSIHASDTTGVLFRMMDLKIEPFLIASSVIGIVAQRMVRRVCPDCSQPIEAPLIEQLAYEREIGEKQTKFLYGTGCKSCAYTGYIGRIGIFEILSMSDAMRMMISN
ncbi:MAG: GspE/PulE family protein, partial [Dehalococcoidales bacterium]|nr:GspE/PulE family protein [Dehalococcoidales bacterium]